MEQKRLMILGSAEDFVGLTKYAVERGIYTVVVDPYQGEAKQYASKAYTVSLNDDELVDQIIKREKIDHVIASFSDILFEKMVLISERNGLPCFCKGDKVRYLRDKVLMKEMLGELGIGTAKGEVVAAENIAKIIKEFKFPCVIKPLDGWGSRGMKIVYSIEEAEEFALKSAVHSTSGSHAMIEELHLGHEINAMSWIHKGEVHLMELGDRETSGRTREKLPYLSREVCPSFYYAELKDRVVDCLHKIAEYLGITEGPLSMQFFYEDGEISIGEVAGRFFGLGQGIVNSIKGIKLYELLINGLYFPEENEVMIRNAVSDLDHYTLALYLTANHGIVRDLGNLPEFAEVCKENIDEFMIYAKENVSSDNLYWIVRVFGQFASREETDAYTKRIYEELYVPDLNGENLVAKNTISKYE